MSDGPRVEAGGHFKPINVTELKRSREANMRGVILKLFNRDREPDERVPSLAQVSDAQLRQLAQKEFGKGSAPQVTRPDIARQFRDFIYGMLRQRTAARSHAGSVMPPDPGDVERELDNIAEQLAPPTAPKPDSDDWYPF